MEAAFVTMHAVHNPRQDSRLSQLGGTIHDWSNGRGGYVIDSEVAEPGRPEDGEIGRASCRERV